MQQPARLARHRGRLKALIAASTLLGWADLPSHAQTVWRCQDGYSAHATCPEAVTIAAQDARSQDQSRAQQQQTVQTQRAANQLEKQRQPESRPSQTAPHRTQRHDAKTHDARQRASEPHFTARVRRTAKTTAQKP